MCINLKESEVLRKIMLKPSETLEIIFSIALSPAETAVEYVRAAIFQVISVRVQKWIWSPTPRHNTPPLTVFINSHHCLANANQLPSEPCERVFLIGIVKKWACSDRSLSFRIVPADSCQPLGAMAIFCSSTSNVDN